MKSKQLAILISIMIVTFCSLGSFRFINKPQNNDVVIIPINLSSQRPIIELKINGKGPYKFIFDTGSSGNIIDANLADELKLNVVGYDSMETPGSENVIISKRVKVSNVSFDGTYISKDAVMNMINLREMVPVDGILNPAFFSDFLITMDYPGSKLILVTGNLDKGDKDVISFKYNSMVIDPDVLIEGIKLGAHLDSGNPGGFDIPFSLKDQLNFKEEPSKAETINTPTASFKRWKAILNGSIQLGSVVYRNPEIHLVEGFRYINLGYQILKDLKTTIDMKSNLIKFEKSTSVLTEKTINKEVQGEENEYTGWYGNHERKIFLENGELYLQRQNAPKLKLVKINEDEYEMVFNMPVMNELPNIRFVRDENKVIGLKFVFKDGKEEFVIKD